MAFRDPFDEWRGMRRRMRHLFKPWAFEEEMPEMMEKRMRPAIVDMEEKDNEIVVTAELPGMDKKGIKVDVTADSISIKAEKREEKEKEEKKKNYYYKERTYGGFYRSMSLPAEIDPASVKATYRDGVLEIKMAKVAGAKKKAMEVQIQ